MSSKHFFGKTAIVTGGSRGIGATIALALAREGCDLVISYEKRSQKAQEVVETIKNLNARAVAVRCDVSVRSDVEAMVKTALNEFRKIDILVNNAGIDVAASLMETTDELWNRTLNVNLTGVFLCTQVAARDMVKRKYGKIVNISSNSGIGVAVEGEAAYAASKAGVIQLTKTAAFELGQYGINVNCVAPGAIETDMLKGELNEQEYIALINIKKERSSLHMIGNPDDVANAVLFFADDRSRFITGRTLLVDGGRRDLI